MAARGLDVERFAFSAAFARNLDYYTGFIFEMQDPRRDDGKPIVGGGRYDGLLQHLGARTRSRRSAARSGSTGSWNKAR